MISSPFAERCGYFVEAMLGLILDLLIDGGSRALSNACRSRRSLTKIAPNRK